METKLLNTGITDLLIVDLLESAHPINVGHNTEGYFLWYKHGHSTYQKRIPIPNPEGYKYTVLGRALDIDEELCQDILPRKSPYSGLIIFKYLDYESPKAFRLDTATESFHSLLKANGILLENPYGNLILKDEDAGTDLEMEVYPRWKQAQSKVSNPLIIKAEKV